MTIRKATQADMERILSVFAYAREFMKRTGNPNQWKEERPPRDTVENFLLEKNLYVIEEEKKIIGVFAFFIGIDETYLEIENGAWLNEEPYGVIHMVASDGSKKGILQEILTYCSSRIGNLRIDTHADNKIMQHLLEKNGFTKCGIIYVDDGTPRLAYQRIG